MNHGERFNLIVNEFLENDPKYMNEIKNFMTYLNERMIIDRAFDLTPYDIDGYFVYSSDSKIGALSTLITHIAALKSLFQYLVEQNLGSRDVLAHISTSSFKDNMRKLVDESFKKPVIPTSLLASTLHKMDMYIENNKQFGLKGINSKKRFYEVMIASLYAKLSLIIPIKVHEMKVLTLGDIKDCNTREIIHNGLKVKLPNGLRTQIIQTIEYAESTYNKKYRAEDSIFEFLYGAVGQMTTTTSIGTSFVKTYEEIGAKEMLKQRLDGKKYKYIYPTESYKTTAILEMLKGGVNIVYLKKLTGLEVGALLSNYNFNEVSSLVDIESMSINSGLVNTEYYTYL